MKPSPFTPQATVRDLVDFAREVMPRPNELVAAAPYAGAAFIGVCCLMLPALGAVLSLFALVVFGRRLSSQAPTT